jgi:FAD/FMN-containing dehydrogenase
MIVSGWGRYPKLDCHVSLPQTRGEISSLLAKGQGIARGSGRAYGDSALNASNTIEMRYFDRFLGFDATTGVLKANAGVQLRDIIETFTPRGWFLPVTPGTSFATVGGAIASDVHGKNHHLVGTFGRHAREIELMLGNGEVVTASPTQYPDLFHATCGGMGLTGVILSVKIQLVPIKSGFIRQKTIKARNIDQLFEAFETNYVYPYSVAWIDCLARDAALGRSVLLLGQHADSGELKIDIRQRIAVPIEAPTFLMNQLSIKSFNYLYYGKAKHDDEKLVGLCHYFYPLDKIGNWNRLYGSHGFIQYQFVIPKERGADNMRKILRRIADSGEGSFLAVIKLLGVENANLLSFPFSGYTLALDFKLSQKTIELLEELDHLIVDMGGRIYLSKDSLMSADTFKHMYPRWELFEDVRQKYMAIGKFASAQSIRLGLQ